MPARDIRRLFALGGVATAAILPFFVLWLQERGLAPDQIGIVLALGALAGVIAAPVWSHLADTELGAVRTLEIASLCSVGAAIALVPAGSRLPLLALVVVVRGLAEAPGTAMSDTIALRTLGPEGSSRYGSIRLWASLGWAAAVLAFGAVYERVGLGPLPVLYAIAMAVFTLAVTRFPRDRPASEDRETGSRLGSAGEAFRASPHLLPFLIGILVVSVSTVAAWSFVPLRIVSRGGGPFLIGLSASLAALVEVPFFRASGWLGEHVGLRALYTLGAGIYALTIASWAFVGNAAAIALVKVLSGAGFGLTYAALVVIAGRLVPERLQATGQTLMQIFGAGIGPVVGTAAGGFIYRNLGPTTLFAAAAIGTAIGVAIVWVALSGSAFVRPAPVAR